MPQIVCRLREAAHVVRGPALPRRDPRNAIAHVLGETAREVQPCRPTGNFPQQPVVFLPEQRVLVTCSELLCQFLAGSQLFWYRTAELIAL